MTSTTRKRLLRHKGRAGGDVDVFAKLPDEVLRSEAYKTLPHPARSVLTILAAQYRGRNNGSLTLTRLTALEYGISNPFTLAESLRELEARGLIVQTRHGTRPVGTLRALSAMFALTWCKIDPAKASDPHDATETVRAPDTWQSWRPEYPGMDWTVTRRDRSREKGRAPTRPFKKVTEDDPFPLRPGDTSSGIPGIPATPEIGIPGIHEKAPGQVSRGCVSEILGVGNRGKSAVAGGKSGGRPNLGAIDTTAGADGPISPPAEIPEGSSNGRRTGPPDPALAASEIPRTSAQAASFRLQEDRRAQYEEVLRRVREKAANAPRRARRLGKPHLQDPYWAFAVALLGEGGLGEKEAGSVLGRLVAPFGWPRVKKAVEDCEDLMLWGCGAVKYVESYSFLLPDVATAAAVAPSQHESAGGTAGSPG